VARRSPNRPAQFSGERKGGGGAARLEIGAHDRLALWDDDLAVTSLGSRCDLAMSAACDVLSHDAKITVTYRARS
jgi:hypothetical protein